MSKERKKAGRPKREGVPLHVYVHPALKAALDALAEDNRRTATAEVVLALEAHLKAAGLWPPADEAASQDEE